MYPIGILAGLLLLYSFISISNFDRAINENRISQTNFVSGQLRAYGSYVAAYARANPSANGSVSDAAAGVPAWLTRPPGMTGLASGGRGYVYFMPYTLAEGNEIARNCGGSLICGVTRSSLLYIPGESTPVPMAMPAGIPANGALVLVL
ncbi:MAG: type IV pilus biogenesis protein PilM [Luteimonas sp.]